MVALLDRTAFVSDWPDREDISPIKLPHPRLHDVPTELQSGPWWIVWRTVDGSRIPCDPITRRRINAPYTGYGAKIEDALDALDTGDWDGLGYLLNNNRLTMIRIQSDSRYQSLVDAQTPTYTERGPDGDTLIIAYGQAPGDYADEDGTDGITIRGSWKGYWFPITLDRISTEAQVKSRPSTISRLYQDLQRQADARRDAAERATYRSLSPVDLPTLPPSPAVVAAPVSAPAPIPQEAPTNDYDRIVAAVTEAGYSAGQAKMVAVALKHDLSLPNDGEALAEMWRQQAGKELRKPGSNAHDEDLTGSPAEVVTHIDTIKQTALALLAASPMSDKTCKQVSDALGAENHSTWKALEQLTESGQIIKFAKVNATLYKWSPGIKKRGNNQQRLESAMQAVLQAHPGITTEKLHDQCRDLLGGTISRSLFYATLRDWIETGRVVQTPTPDKIKNAKTLSLA